MTPSKRYFLAAVLSTALTSPALHGDGPGLPNVAYLPSEEGTVLSLNDPGKAISSMTMHRGYLFVPLGADHGGGQGTGDFAFYDISDPENVSTFFDSRDHPTVYGNSSLVNYAGDFAEAHHLPVSGDLMMISERRSGSAGFSILDVGNLYDGNPSTLPEIVSRHSFSGVTSPSNYDGYSFALGWQGNKYLYAPTGSNGLHIVDTSNLASPQELAVIPKSALSNLTLRSAVPIGNLLVLTTTTGGPAGSMSAAFYDISDPANPQQLNTMTAPVGYHSFIYGSSLYGGGFPLQGHDFSDPQNIVTTTLNTNPGYDRPEYGFGKDGHIFVGHYPGMTKWLLDGTNTTQVQTVNSGLVDDHAFITPIGNLIVLSSDHNNDRKLTIGIHDHQQDTTPPAVNFVSPADGETNVAVTSRVGLCFTDFIDQSTVDTSSLVVREFGGATVPGSYSTMFGIVNFAPDGDLASNTTYEVVLATGGVADQSGNAVASETVVAQFSTGNILNTYSASVTADGPREVGQSATLVATVSNPGAFNLEHAWDFGDGTPMTAYSASTTTSHSYATAGNHVVTFFTRIVGQTSTTQATAVQVAHNPLSAEAPANSSTIVHDDANGLVWNVNPDNGTVTALDDTTFAKVHETSVGANPKTLSLGPANTLWVANKQAATLSVINRATGAVSTTHALPFASAPHAILVDIPNAVAYVSLEGTGQLAKIDAATGNVVGLLEVGPWPRNLSLDASRDTLWVARFISPDAAGEVTSVDTNLFTVNGVTSLAQVFEPDSLSNGRGLPNYLGALAVSPDATQAFVPSKKDNIFRGMLRDGQQLTFEHSVRSMATRVDLVSGWEDPSQRIDFDNSDFATAAAFSPLGNQVFYTTSGSATIWVVDAYDRNNSFTLDSGGRAPAGLTMSADGSRLFVHNFMSRTVTVFDTSAACASFCGTSPQLASVPTVASEVLAPDVLLGKQIFYDSSDPRLAQEGYMSCASCHLDGGHDGRVWDFTGFGEGLRTTIDLNGRGVGHGPVHWTANFDEVQDFEGQIRGFAQGTGLMSDTDFNHGTRSQPLGLAKGGSSSDLDALAAYVASLTTVGASPHREPGGTLTADALAGREIFRTKDCASCHAGEAFTDSSSLARHDVGTLTSDSGQRLGGPLDGLDTPGLRGLWMGAPYLHDGTAATVLDVLTTRNIAGLHGDLFDLTATELGQLEAYLLQIDDLELTAPVTGANGAPVLTDPGDQSSTVHQAVSLALAALDPETDPLHWSASGLPSGMAIDPATGAISGSPDVVGDHTVSIGVRDSSGNSDQLVLTWTVLDDVITGDALTTGNITREWWTGIAGNSVSLLTGDANYPDNPSGADTVSLFEAPSNFNNSFGSRIHGYLVPPVTGDYTFWIATDDNGELWLSSNHDPENAALIAGVNSPPGWTGPREWNKFPEQQSVTISLDANVVYYIRALQKDGNGGDNFAVAWQGPGIAQDVIPGSNLAPFQALDLNQAPLFGQSDYNFSIPENAALSDPVGSVAATDPDAGQSVGYSIVSGNSEGRFAIDPVSGLISTSAALDYETQPVFHLLVQATDDDNPAKATTVPVTVTVTNILENNQEVVAFALSGPGGKYEGHANPALIGFRMDPDADLTANALEVLFGTDASEPDTLPPFRFTTAESGGKTYAVYEFDVDAAMDDLIHYSYWASSNLDGWGELAGPAVLISESAGVRTYQIQDDVSMDDSSQRFFRLGVVEEDAK